MHDILLGRNTDFNLLLDIQKLVVTRMLIQTNSGGGKSTLMRLIVERAAAILPFLVLDWEGEFITLRERLDFVLVGKDGEIPADLHSAKLLARKLMELHASAVIDLSDLEPADRREYVRDFLDSLVHLPRQFWHPTLVCIDEAHQLCPEAGKADSVRSVINLMSLGRKRGLCGILATQRLSKLHKDAASECNNVLIGRTYLDVDQIRAGDALGQSKADRVKLRDLEAGEFFAFGAALSVKGVVRFRADLPKTAPPKSGERHKLTVPKASEVISQIVAQLADLSQKAEEEIRDLETAQQRISELEGELAIASLNLSRSGVYQDEFTQTCQAYERKILSLNDRIGLLERQNAKFLDNLREIANLATEDLEDYRELKESAEQQADRLTDALVDLNLQPVTELPPQIDKAIKEWVKPASPIAIPKSVATDLPAGEKKILTAIAQYPGGITKEHLGILTDYKRSSRDEYVKRLKQKEFVMSQGNRFYGTPAGIAALGDFKPLPTGKALQNYWLQNLPKGEREILAILINHYPRFVDRDFISERTPYKRSSRDEYIKRLAARQLVQTEPGRAKASNHLFEAPK